MKHLLATATLALALVCVGCTRAPDMPPAEIEALAMTVAQRGSADAERQLRALADGGNTVARRELGILYRNRPALRNEAMELLRRAALAGDAQAAYHLGELYRSAQADNPSGHAAAWQWYRRAADGGHARAALALGLMAKNGDGVPRNMRAAAHWLHRASALGNAHAMFLLSYLYRDGEGVPADPARARALLEEAAEHEYPPALQELALTVEDPQRAGHLMKEAVEHRRNNWNRF